MGYNLQLDPLPVIGLQHIC